MAKEIKETKVLKLIPLHDPVLRRKTKGVSTLLPRHRTLIYNMIATILEQEGVGLSANQVGSTARIAIVYLPTMANPLVLINPRLLKRKGRYRTTEGCLSLPGFRGTTERFERVTVRAVDMSGEVFTLEAEGLLAHVIQHEVDHLDGKLYLERLVTPDAG